MLTVALNGVTLSLNTRPSLFSPNAADKGTLAMLRTADKYLAETSPGNPLKIGDLGCGYGLVGLYLAKKYPFVTAHLMDIDPIACECARLNAAANEVEAKVFISDGFSQVDETGYGLMLCNPPYHTDFSVAKRLIEKSFNRLSVGGLMFMVTKRREWYKNKFIAVFGGVKVTEDDGYFIFSAEKRGMHYGKGK